MDEQATLTGDKGAGVSGTTDRSGQIVWTDLPVDEKFALTGTAAPEGYQIMSLLQILRQSVTFDYQLGVEITLNL